MPMPDQPPDPNAVGAGSSALAGHVARGRRRRFMRCIFTLMVVATLFTACRKQVAPPATTPNVSRYLAYPEAEVVANFTTKAGEVMPVILPVAGNTSYPTGQPANVTFKGSTGYGNITVNYVCYGRFGEGDIYAFSIGTNDGKYTVPLHEVACDFNGQEMLVLETNGVKITLKQKPAQP
jgi:hypothetical protein